MRRVRAMGLVAAAALGVGCAGGPGPGDPGYAFNVAGAYEGRLVVERERFHARLELQTQRGGTVAGGFRVGRPVRMEGQATGRVFDDLLRLSVRYEASGRRRCDGRIEGILTVEPGGDVIEGPVTITDCRGALAGRMSFRR